MANPIIFISVIITLLSIGIAMIRFVIGPSVLDRVVAFDTVSIIAISLIVIIAHLLERFIYIDVCSGLCSPQLHRRARRRPLPRKGAVMEKAGSILLLTGSIIFFLSALGILRMPDVYNRIQTGTKATTLGTIFMMIGMALIHPEWGVKLIILILFILLTNPVSSHVVARGAHFSGQKMSRKTKEDKLAPEQKEAR